MIESWYFWIIATVIVIIAILFCLLVIKPSGTNNVQSNNSPPPISSNTSSSSSNQTNDPNQHIDPSTVPSSQPVRKTYNMLRADTAKGEYVIIFNNRGRHTVNPFTPKFLPSYYNTIIETDGRIKIVIKGDPTNYYLAYRRYMELFLIREQDVPDDNTFYFIAKSVTPTEITFLVETGTDVRICWNNPDNSFFYYVAWAADKDVRDKGKYETGSIYLTEVTVEE